MRIKRQSFPAYRTCNSLKLFLLVYVRPRVYIFIMSGYCPHPMGLAVSPTRLRRTQEELLSYHTSHGGDTLRAATRRLRALSYIWWQPRSEPITNSPSRPRPLDDEWFFHALLSLRLSPIEWELRIVIDDIYLVPRRVIRGRAGRSYRGGPRGSRSSSI